MPSRPDASGRGLPLRELQQRVMNTLLGRPADAPQPRDDGAGVLNTAGSRSGAARSLDDGAGALDSAGPRSNAAQPLDAAISLEAVMPLIDSSGTTAAARLEVYRNNVRGNFIDALRSSYPVILRLVGGEYFQPIGRHFHARHPSPSGDLLHAGERFPAYLAELHRGDQFRYLADVARLEWLVQQALLAADHAPLDLGRLAAVAPSAYDTLRFELHPALRLFESPYPAQRIWEVNVNGDAEPETVDLDGGGERLALMQSRLQLHFHRLAPGELCFLRAVGGGDSFAAAVAAGGANDSQFDAAATLRRFVAAQAIVDFHPLRV